MPLRVVGEQAQNITVLYRGVEVKNLRTVIIELFNNGSEVIKDVSLTIKVASPSKLLALNAVSAASTDGSADPEYAHDESGGLVQIPYVNAYRSHKQTHLISMVIDGSVLDFTVHGGGENWSIVDADEPNLLRRTLFLLFTASPVFIAVLSAFTANSLINLQPGKSSVTDIATFALLICALATAVSGTIIYKSHERPKTRSKPDVLKRLKEK